MNHALSNTPQPHVVAVCISSGSVPKTPVDRAEVTVDGLAGDGHDHEKHRRSDRAVSIQDIELLDEIKAEGYTVAPGIIGENLTVRHLHVQQLSPGDRLQFEQGPLLELTQPRKPCYVLDKIHPDLKEVVVGRCGFMARVLATGSFQPGQYITVLRGDNE
jgi:MOSC domain-containing protein YiiM